MRLTDIYTSGELDDEDEALFHAMSEEALEASFDVRDVPHDRLGDLMTMMGDMPVLQAFSDHASPDQEELVRWKMAHFDEERVIVLEGNRVIDGNHHLVAAHRSGRPVRTIDLAEIDCDPSPGP